MPYSLQKYPTQIPTLQISKSTWFFPSASVESDELRHSFFKPTAWVLLTQVSTFEKHDTRTINSWTNFWFTFQNPDAQGWRIASPLEKSKCRSFKKSTLETSLDLVASHSKSVEVNVNLDTKCSTCWSFVLCPTQRWGGHKCPSSVCGIQGFMFFG